MPMRYTENYNLPVAGSSDNDIDFITFRTSVAGTSPDSGMNILDETIKELSDKISELEESSEIVFVNFIRSDIENIYNATIPEVTYYKNNMLFIAKFDSDNTSSVTLNINSLGNVILYKNETFPMESGDIIRDQYTYLLKYEDDKFKWILNISNKTIDDMNKNIYDPDNIGIGCVFNKNTISQDGDVVSILDYKWTSDPLGTVVFDVFTNRYIIPDIDVTWSGTIPFRVLNLKPGIQDQYQYFKIYGMESISLKSGEMYWFSLINYNNETMVKFYINEEFYGDMNKKTYDPVGSGINITISETSYGVDVLNNRIQLTYNNKDMSTNGWFISDTSITNSTTVLLRLKNDDETYVEKVYSIPDYLLPLDFESGRAYSFILQNYSSPISGVDGIIHFKTGGAALNYKVVGGTSQPTNPNGTIIWVETDIAVKKHSIETVNHWLDGEVDLYDTSKISGVGYIDANGNVVALDTARYTDYLPLINGSTNITFKSSSSQTSSSRHAFYDASKTFISAINLPFPNDITVSVPENAVFVRCSILTQDVSTFYCKQIKTATESPESGDVWINTDTATGIPISVSKQQQIMVYPTSAQQYNGSIWENKPILVYTDGEWK